MSRRQNAVLLMVKFVLLKEDVLANKLELLIGGVFAR
jgi:hypothetical protein